MKRVFFLTFALISFCFSAEQPNLWEHFEKKYLVKEEFFLPPVLKKNDLFRHWCVCDTETKGEILSFLKDCSVKGFLSDDPEETQVGEFCYFLLTKTNSDEAVQFLDQSAEENQLWALRKKVDLLNQSDPEQRTPWHIRLYNKIDYKPEYASKELIQEIEDKIAEIQKTTGKNCTKKVHNFLEWIQRKAAQYSTDYTNVWHCYLSLSDPSIKKYVSSSREKAENSILALLDQKPYVTSINYAFKPVAMKAYSREGLNVSPAFLAELFSDHFLKLPTYAVNLNSCIAAFAFLAKGGETGIMQYCIDVSISNNSNLTNIFDQCLKISFTGNTYYPTTREKRKLPVKQRVTALQMRAILCYVYDNFFCTTPEEYESVDLKTLNLLLCPIRGNYCTCFYPTITAMHLASFMSPEKMDCVIQEIQKNRQYAEDLQEGTIFQGYFHYVAEYYAQLSELKSDNMSEIELALENYKKSVDQGVFFSAFSAAQLLIKKHTHDGNLASNKQKPIEYLKQFIDSPDKTTELDTYLFKLRLCHDLRWEKTPDTPEDVKKQEKLVAHLKLAQLLLLENPTEQEKKEAMEAARFASLEGLKNAHTLAAHLCLELGDKDSALKSFKMAEEKDVLSEIDKIAYAQLLLDKDASHGQPPAQEIHQLIDQVSELLAQEISSSDEIESDETDQAQSTTPIVSEEQPEQPSQETISIGLSIPQLLGPGMGIVPEGLNENSADLRSSDRLKQSASLRTSSAEVSEIVILKTTKIRNPKLLRQQLRTLRANAPARPIMPEPEHSVLSESSYTLIESIFDNTECLKLDINVLYKLFDDPYFEQFDTIIIKPTKSGVILSSNKSSVSTHATHKGSARKDAFWKNVRTFLMEMGVNVRVPT